MDALKKFLNKKKSDVKFKAAGPGQKLADDGQSKGKSATPATSGAGAHHKPSSVQTEEKRQAAAAALARLEKQRKPDDNEKDRLAARQLAFIKEQARREIEAEMRLKESGEMPEEKTRSQMEASKVTPEQKVVDPANYAVDGVFFTCPLIGPEVATKEAIHERIKEFLRDQPEEELAITSCLMIHSCNKPIEKVNLCVDILGKYLDNIISNPDNPKVRKIRLTNKAYQEKVAKVEGAAEFLSASGFDHTQMKNDDTGEMEEVWLFNPDRFEDAIAHITELRDTLRHTTPIRPELDRNLQVLMPAEVKQRKELPPQFYQLTVEELQREQKLKTELAERELTLRTKAQREMDERREQRMYRYCVMRVRFPDGFTLQGTFWAHDKLSQLYDFVRDNIVVEDIKFTLKMPRGEALPESNLECTLAENRLPPASIVNFHAENPPSQIASGELSFLKPEILALVKSMK